MNTRSAEHLEQLIGFDTTSYKSNLELISYIRDFLTSLNVESQCVFDESGQKANLYASIGPADTPGVMLSGHTDVVPVDGQAWTCDPFSLTRRDGCYLGRGAADMKGFIASALAAVPAMTSSHLVTPIHLAFSYDEEVGCLGVRRLIDMLGSLPTRPGLAIVGEPTGMQAVIGHKGKTAFTVSVSGKAGHSAYTRDAVNAVEYAARLVTQINDLHRQRASEGPFDAGYRVPHTTLHVGAINGGTALNIVPGHCEFIFEIRNIPEDNPDQLVADIKANAVRLQEEMRSGCPGAAINIEHTTAYPGLQTDPADPAVKFVQALLVSAGASDASADPGKVSFGTEGGLFSKTLAVPAVVCGPGNIAQAHKPDEYLAESQLSLCDQFMEQLVNRCQQPLGF